MNKLIIGSALAFLTTGGIFTTIYFSDQLFNRKNVNSTYRSPEEPSQIKEAPKETSVTKRSEEKPNTEES